MYGQVKDKFMENAVASVSFGKSEVVKKKRLSLLVSEKLNDNNCTALRCTALSILTEVYNPGNTQSNKHSKGGKIKDWKMDVYI